MPKYVLNKLVRDKLRNEYAQNNQKATYKKLSSDELAQALMQKLVEEVKEATVSDRQSMVTELADIYQVIEDTMNVYNITPQEVYEVKQAKLEKRGGFSGATFVQTLELAEDDEWNEYYRASPETFQELK